MATSHAIRDMGTALFIMQSVVNFQCSLIKTFRREFQFKRKVGCYGNSGAIK